MFLTDKQNISRLGSDLNKHFDKLINNEVEKSKERGQEDVSNSKLKEAEWSLPSHIIVFLESIIENVTTLKLTLMSWPEFKKIIFDIIDHRIEFSAEINGAINTTYMSVDEHLIMYWVGSFLLTPMSKPKVEMHGTKNDIQTKMIEFLYSLKYYSNRW